MSVDHLVMYQKMTSSKRYGNPPLPDWVRKQNLSYPHHRQHSELIEAYSKAKKQYDESVEVLQSAYQRRWQDPENPQRSESVKQCQQQVEETKKVLEQAQEALQEFNDHSPEQRIGFYEAEIKEWETQLVEARRAEQEYTEAMLNDPTAARKRLERQVNGYSGAEAEYSSEQLSKLRSLKAEVRSIEVEILNCLRDIQRIHELVAQEERSSQIQAIMDAAVPKFNEACAGLAVALAELQSLAAQHDIRVISEYNLQLPTKAKFKQSNSPIEGDSTINIIFSK